MTFPRSWGALCPLARPRFLTGSVARKLSSPAHESCICSVCSLLQSARVDSGPPLAAAARQPRKECENVVPEFKTFFSFTCSNEELSDIFRSCQSPVKEAFLIRGTTIPPGSTFDFEVIEKGSVGKSKVRVQVAWTAKEFAEKAKLLQHPFDRRRPLPTSTSRRPRFFQVAHFGACSHGVTAQRDPEALCRSCQRIGR